MNEKNKAKILAEQLPDIERWVDIEDFPDYEISNMGFIRTKNQQKPIKIDFKFGKYPMVFLTSGTVRRKVLYVHRLIAIAFIPNPENKPVVNHINGIKSDFSLNNLEWVTTSENAKHANSTGLNHVPGLFGEDHPMAKLKERDVLDILKMYFIVNIPVTTIGRAFDIHTDMVGLIVRGKNWNNIFKAFMIEFKNKISPYHKKQRSQIVTGKRHKSYWLEA